MALCCKAFRVRAYVTYCPVSDAFWSCASVWLFDLNGGISSEMSGGIVAHVAGLDGVRWGTSCGTCASCVGAIEVKVVRECAD